MLGITASYNHLYGLPCIDNAAGKRILGVWVRLIQKKGPGQRSGSIAEALISRM